MARLRTLLLLGILAGAGTMLHAQILPPTGGALGGATRIPEAVVAGVGRATGPLTGSINDLAAARLERLRALARRNSDAVEWFDDVPVVRGQITAIDLPPESRTRIEAAGFRLIDEQTIEGVGIRSATLALPSGWSVRKAMERLRSIAPEGSFSPNHIYEPSGSASASPAVGAALAARMGGAARIAIIDGGVGSHPSLTGPIEQRGFARGAPSASAHGTALASLVSGSASPKGVLPGAPLLVADVYGRDPAGGNAVAIARAIGWAVSRGAAVANISLVGPPNALIGATIRAARARGLIVVAPVGNDGPAAPPAYPASYPEVIAVSAVNGRNRALVEAGHALHLDYVAPGADIEAAAVGGRTAAVRGTSYAAPLVAARLAAHYPAPAPVRAASAIAALDAEARDLGPAGGDRLYGRGLICGTCRPGR